MLQVETEEQKVYIDELFNGASIWFCDGICDGVYIDDWVSFDTLAAIVDYLRNCNATEHKSKPQNKV